MSRERDDTGQFTQTVTLEDVLSVFEIVDGPIVTSADVADATGCTRESARQKLKQLHDQGRLGRRKTAGRYVYWRLDNDTPRGIEGEDPFWNADAVSGDEEVDARDVDEVLYGEAQ